MMRCGQRWLGRGCTHPVVCRALLLRTQRGSGRGHGGDTCPRCSRHDGGCGVAEQGSERWNATRQDDQGADGLAGLDYQGVTDGQHIAAIVEKLGHVVSAAADQKCKLTDMIRVGLADDRAAVKVSKSDVREGQWAAVGVRRLPRNH